MKYTILINQSGIAAGGYAETTDLVDWALLDYIRDCYSSQVAADQSGHVLISYKGLMADMPLLGLKSKAGASQRITKLTNLGLIYTRRDKFGRIYVALSLNAIVAMGGWSRGVSARERA